MNTIFKNQAWLLKRETWEHRAFWITPLVVSCVLLVMGVVGVGGMIGADHFSLSHNSSGIDLSTLDGDDHYVLLLMNAGMQLAPYMIALVIMLLFYCLDTLYGDRRDRSILFWSSLPVSDTATVLSKVSTLVLTAPAITFVFFVVINLLSLLALSIGGAVIGVSYWYWLTHPGTLLLTWLHVANDLLVWSLVLLPIYGWLLLASAWARKAPFLWAVAPPLLIMWVEWLLYDTSYLARVIGQYFETIASKFEVGMQSVSINKFSEVGMLQPAMDDSWIWNLLTIPAFWGGLAVAVVFISTAIWLRRWRNED